MSIDVPSLPFQPSKRRCTFFRQKSKLHFKGRHRVHKYSFKPKFSFSEALQLAVVIFSSDAAGSLEWQRFFQCKRFFVWKIPTSFRLASHSSFLCLSSTSSPSLHSAAVLCTLRRANLGSKFNATQVKCDRQLGKAGDSCHCK